MGDQVLAKTEGCRVCLAGGGVVRLEHAPREKRFAIRSTGSACRTTLPRVRNRIGHLFAVSTRPTTERRTRSVAETHRCALAGGSDFGRRNGRTVVAHVGFGADAGLKFFAALESRKCLHRVA